MHMYQWHELRLYRLVLSEELRSEPSHRQLFVLPIKCVDVPVICQLFGGSV